MTELTTHDYDVLIEAIDCWPERDSAGALALGLMSSMMATTPEQKEEAKQEREKETENRRLQKKGDEITAVRVKVKLLDLRDALTLEEGRQILTGE